MKIHVSAKPGRKNEYIEYVGRASFQIAVKELPIKGQSNNAIIKKLSEYFKIPKSEIKLIHGQFAKQKVFEIPISEDELNNLPLESNLQIKLF